ncbi:MAG: RsmE family RNA methyltransferase [Verrucomicrobiota bacterium]
MSDFRCHCDATIPRIPEIELSPSESHHLVATCRARQGDEIIAFNGQGIEWTCTLSKADKRKAILSPIAHKLFSKPKHRITLIQAAPKAKGLENIVRRATELGVWNIQPIITSRTELKVITDREATKLAKLKASTIEGAKQSGNPWLPEINGFASLHNLEFPGALKLVASLQETTTTVKTAFDSFAKEASEDSAPKPLHQTEGLPFEVFCLIGPEGDFDSEEYGFIAQQGFRPVTLGPYVQRCETAAVSMLSAVQQQLIQL